MTRKRPRLIHTSRIVPVLLGVLIVTVPLAYITKPYIEHRVLIYRLTSPDVDKRNRALMYVAANAAGDERVLASAVEQLTRVDDDGFALIVDALQSAGCWDRGHIPDEAWLRWIGLQAGADGVEAPTLAAQRLAQLQDLAGDPRVLTLLKELTKHSEPDVRYNALCGAAELVLSAEDRGPYVEIFLACQDDGHELIARHAAIVLYLLGEADAAVPEWLNETAQARDEHYGPEELGRLLWSIEAPLRDVGCVLTVRDLPEGLHRDLIGELLDDGQPEAMMSGAVLAGMTGKRIDLLRETIQKQDDWALATTLKLGLWMADTEGAVELDPAALLARDDIPRSTVILTMLHRGDYRALDALFNPHGEAPDDLAYLLEGYGWWRVLERYLPEDAPRWRYGLDEERLRWQVDLLRDWYLMRRQQLNQ